MLHSIALGLHCLPALARHLSLGSQFILSHHTEDLIDIIYEWICGCAGSGEVYDGGAAAIPAADHAAAPGQGALCGHHQPGQDLCHPQGECPSQSAFGDTFIMAHPFSLMQSPCSVPPCHPHKLLIGVALQPSTSVGHWEGLTQEPGAPMNMTVADASPWHSYHMSEGLQHGDEMCPSCHQCLFRGERPKDGVNGVA